MASRKLAEITNRIEARDHASPRCVSLSQGGPLIVGLDGAYIRAASGFQTLHSEVTTGRVDAEGRLARHFAVALNALFFVKAQSGTSAPGFMAEPEEFAELVIVQLVSRPMVIDQPNNMAAKLPACVEGCRPSG
ncbi:hypothetical protein [Microvirga rosea]|uniref:hypothetical protein n=1 Tax=Microvirga rosea TaxID=2715425 RepID=UPI001D0B70F2|nr:hypothetical protein [Microvirga rosea]MCB8823311.1 hypothetical protein [Microvirga rosea]